MIRDTHKNVGYFEKQILALENSCKRRKNKIDTGQIKEDRLQPVLIDISNNYLRLFCSKYSSGYFINELKEDIELSINTLSSGGQNGYLKLKHSKNEIFNQYGGSIYENILSLLSVGFLLNINQSSLDKIVTLIDVDGVKDNLFEFIIKGYKKKRKSLNQESYTEWSKVPLIHKSLREVILSDNKVLIEETIFDYLNNDWYKNHKEFGWFDSHKKGAIYSGYWSFESAVVVAILDLDDSKFRDNEYYPKDLVDYYRGNNSTPPQSHS